MSIYKLTFLTFLLALSCPMVSYSQESDTIGQDSAVAPHVTEVPTVYELLLIGNKKVPAVFTNGSVVVQVRSSTLILHPAQGKNIALYEIILTDKDGNEFPLRLQGIYRDQGSMLNITLGRLQPQRVPKQDDLLIMTLPNLPAVMNPMIFKAKPTEALPVTPDSLLGETP